MKRWMLLFAGMVGAVCFWSGMWAQRRSDHKQLFAEAAKALTREGRFAVPVASAPARGPATAPITIVEYSDYECQQCADEEKVLSEIRSRYGEKVRLVWKDRPLLYHKGAVLAAAAARAAGEQGKYWEMHDLLVANHERLARADLDRYASQLGLDGARFAAALDSHKFEEAISNDRAEAAKVGARGIPDFFVNGRRLRGARPLPEFTEIIDDELELAHAVAARGVAPDAVYAQVTSQAPSSDGPVKPAAATSDAPAADATKMTANVDVGKSYTRGPANAPVTIVEFADFQCPYCAKVDGTVAEVLRRYGDRVRFVWKNAPLPFHEHAMFAAQAALAAGAQGKFQAMHDWLLQHQDQLDRPSVEAYADGGLHLDMKRFRQAIDKEEFKAQVQAELAQEDKISPSLGTPTFVVNGHVLQGAQLATEFQSIIEPALDKHAARAATPPHHGG